MVKRIVPALAATLLTALALGVAQAEEEGWWYAGSLTLTSDYIFRGVSQSKQKPALQPSLDVGHANGFYAGVWGSNVNFDAPDGINTEVDIYVGWALEFGNDTSLDVYLVRYMYPGARPGFGINYNELVASYGFLEYFTGTLGYTNNYVNSDQTAFYYRLGAEFPLGETDYKLALGAGLNDISQAAGSDYWDYRLGVSRSWKALKADLSFHDTSGFDAAVQSFLGPRTWADRRFVLTFMWEF